MYVVAFLSTCDRINRKMCIRNIHFFYLIRNRYNLAPRRFSQKTNTVDHVAFERFINFNLGSHISDVNNIRRISFNAFSGLTLCERCESHFITKEQKNVQICTKFRIIAPISRRRKTKRAENANPQKRPC